MASAALIGVLALIPAGGYLLIAYSQPGVLADPIVRPLLVLVASSYYLLIWLGFMAQFVDYYLDSWIVTTDKIYDIEQNGLFSRVTAELELSKIQDITSEVKGIIPTIFNYGNVYIQTAAETDRFDFEQVHRPDDIRKAILELVEKQRTTAPPTSGV